MDTSIFEQVTSALTVRAICSPLGPDIPSGSTEADLAMMHCELDLDPLINPSRVVSSDGGVAGLVWYEDFWGLNSDKAHTVDDVLTPIEPNAILSSSTTIFDAVAFFSRSSNGYFYVLDLNSIIGVLFYADLFKPLGRLAFLALALELEDLALTLCRSAAVSERCWASISDNRKRKAVDLFKIRYKREPKLDGNTQEQEKIIFLPRTLSDLSLLIGCTNLVDKATMIWKQKLIPAETQAEILGFFNDLKEIRDQCAHPGRDEELMPKARLAHFINSANSIRSSLSQSLLSTRSVLMAAR